MPPSRKIPKAQAVYFTAKEIGGSDLGARCGKCRDFIPLTSECVILRDPRVSASRGVCEMYIFGPPSHSAPMRLISKKTVGYIEGADVPTYCGRCEYYGGGDNEKGPCKKVGDSENDTVEFAGCCNLYEAR